SYLPEAKFSTHRLSTDRSTPNSRATAESERPGCSANFTASRLNSDVKLRLCFVPIAHLPLPVSHHQRCPEKRGNSKDRGRANGQGSAGKGHRTAARQHADTAGRGGRPGRRPAEACRGA